MIEDEKTKFFTFIKIFIICFISFFVALFIALFIAVDRVYAENEIQTIALGYNREQSTPSAANTDITIFQSQNSLNNWGRGTLLFTLATYKKSNNTSFDIGTIREVKVTSNSNIYICDIGTIASNFDEETNFKSNIYSVMCDINIGSNGIQRIDIQTNNTVNNTYYIKTSEYMTFSKNLILSTQAHIDQVNSTLVTYLTSVYNASLQTATNTGATNNYLSAIQVLLNTNLTSIVNQLISIDSKLDELLENQKVCDEILIDKNYTNLTKGYLNSSGNVVENNQNKVTNFIEVNQDSTIVNNLQGRPTDRTCFYDQNKTKISCIETLNTGNITIPTNAKYIRVTINISYNAPQVSIKTCKNGNQAITDKQEETNDILTDDSVDDPSNSITDMEQNVPTNSVISDLLTLPIRLFQNVINAIDGQCQTFNLGSLYGTNLTLPCINIQRLIGSQLFGVIDILLSGIFVLSIRKKFVDIFENITSLKNGGNELE